MALLYAKWSNLEKWLPKPAAVINCAGVLWQEETEILQPVLVPCSHQDVGNTMLGALGWRHVEVPRIACLACAAWLTAA